MKKFIAVALSVCMVGALLAGCGSKTESAPATEAATTAAATEAAAEEAAEEVAEEAVEETEAAAEAATFTAAMVTDTGGVNDQGFNQGSWEGLLKCQDEGWATAKYLESKQEADYATNLDTLSDEGNQIIWGIGYLMADAILNAAATNPDNLYAIIDNSYAEIPENVICAVFQSQDCSFEMGYLAGKMTQTDNVGVVGGVKGEIIDAFEFGYRAGVAYAAKELGKEIEVQVQYADSFADAAKGKAIATSMYQNGADIVFQAAGGCGVGVIEAAKELGKYAIGADTDQNYLAPDNVISSAMKDVGAAIHDICKAVADGEDLGGTCYVGTLANGAVGYAPTTDKLVPAEIISDIDAVAAKLGSGEIVAPKNEEEFNAYIASLN